MGIPENVFFERNQYSQFFNRSVLEQPVDLQQVLEESFEVNKS